MLYVFEEPAGYSRDYQVTDFLGLKFKMLLAVDKYFFLGGGVVERNILGFPKILFGFSLEIL